MSQERFITFRYVERDTPLHNSDPFGKMSWLLVTLVTVLATSDFLLIILQAMLTVLATVTFGQIKLRQLKPLLLILFFMLMMAFYGLFTAPTVKYAGGMYRVWSGLNLSLEGALAGLVAGGRFLVPAVVGLAIAFTTRQQDLTRFFGRFMPYRIAYTASIGLAMVPVVQELYENVQKALTVRGLGFHGSLGSKFRAYTRLVFVLTVGMLRHADVMALSMANRAFGAYPDRTYYRDYYFPSRLGWILTAGYAVIAAVVLAFAILGIEPTAWLLQNM